jgi:hypothetical protein
MTKNNQAKTTQELIEEHLFEIAAHQEENGVFAMDAPEYLKVIALSLHTLATIERIKLMKNVVEPIPDFLAKLKKRVNDTEAIIKNHERWGNL